LFLSGSAKIGETVITLLGLRQNQRICGAKHFGSDKGRHDSRLPMANCPANLKDMHVGAGRHVGSDDERRAGW